ncbi:methyltransferase domain-containing protein [Roseobacter sp. MH60115]|uniref:methyltransferase domain-containing protein n=1 Tax=Roseobacter sp. MH60115 TaxID=2785324 RepID=UPI0018A257DB|nr:methyltransferase domain-containing protein [Roseobacter sp. MH60115]
MQSDWDRSAAAWIAAQGDEGDFSRRRVLDTPMLQRVTQARPDRVLDLGCGEGRFCRKLAERGYDVTGLDPTAALLAQAEARGGARYVTGRAEALPFGDGSFDMVVSYLSLLDIEGIDAALDEVARVLAPGGHFLIANLAGIATAADIKGGGWEALPDGGRRIIIRHYLESRAMQSEWKGISVTNWHRPLSVYMQALLERGFHLTHFDEPSVPDPQWPQEEAYNQAPYQMMMEWRL